MKRRIRRLAWILWPSFLLASVVEMLVFAMVDPSDVHWRGEPLPLSRQGLYTASFFVFWILAMGSSALTALLAMSRREVNTPGECQKKQRRAHNAWLAKDAGRKD